VYTYRYNSYKTKTYDKSRHPPLYNPITDGLLIENKIDDKGYRKLMKEYCNCVDNKPVICELF
jgi:hypothetical protein